MIFAITRERFHNEVLTGELSDPMGGPMPPLKAKARVSNQANYYDDADRLMVAINVGTNGGTTYSRSLATMIPARSDTVLRTDYAYNAAGWVETVTDPRGILHKSLYDNAGRVTKTIEAYADGVPSNNDDHTTEYSYDSGNRVQTLTARLTDGTDFQRTQWVYGVTCAASGSALFSNDLVREVRYPRKVNPWISEPSALPTDVEKYQYNALG